MVQTAPQTESWDVDPFAAPPPAPAPKESAPNSKGSRPSGRRKKKSSVSPVALAAGAGAAMGSWAGRNGPWQGNTIDELAEVGVAWILFSLIVVTPPTVRAVSWVGDRWDDFSGSRVAGLMGFSESSESADTTTEPGLAQGTTYASPIVGKTLDDLVAYQPSFGQSFGPKTGNQRSYGPHGGVDFDCRVGGCTGAAVAAPISGRVSEIRRIGTSANGGSFQVHIQGQDWAGAVEHQLVHVDSITVAVGNPVTAGQVVAKVSPTDSVSTGPHLDWKIKRGGAWVNPQTWAREAKSQNAAQQRQAPGAALGEPIPDELLKRAIGRAEGTRDSSGRPTISYHGHRDPGWSGRCQNQGSFSYQHCAASPEAADAAWLVTLRKAEQDIQAQSVAKFGKPLSQAAMVAALDGYTQSPDAGKRFVGVLASADPSPEQLIAARTAALEASRREKGGPPMNVAADQQRRVSALLEQLSR